MAWLLTKENRAPEYAWFIPVVLVLFSGLHSLMEWRALRIIARYLRLREQAYGAGNVGVVPLDYWDTWRVRQSPSREAALAWAFW